MDRCRGPSWFHGEHTAWPRQAFHFCCKRPMFSSAAETLPRGRQPACKRVQHFGPSRALASCPIPSSNKAHSFACSRHGSGALPPHLHLQPPRQRGLPSPADRHCPAGGCAGQGTQSGPRPEGQPGLQAACVWRLVGRCVGGRVEGHSFSRFWVLCCILCSVFWGGAGAEGRPCCPWPAPRAHTGVVGRGRRGGERARCRGGTS